MTLEIFSDRGLTNRIFIGVFAAGSNVFAVIPRNGGARIKTKLPFTKNIRNSSPDFPAIFNIIGSAGGGPDVMSFVHSPASVPVTSSSSPASASVTLNPIEVLHTNSIPTVSYGGGEETIEIKNGPEGGTTQCDLELSFIAI